MTALALTSAPAIEPLSRSDLYKQLRLVATGSPASHDDDDLLDDCIKAAREFFDGRYGVLSRALITQTWRWSLDNWQSGLKDGNYLRVPLPPLQSVSSITYKDETGTSVTWNSSKYVVDADSQPGRIALAYGETWPSVYPEINAITITFVAGYGADATDVPQDLRNAMKLICGSMYENREAHISGTIVAQFSSLLSDLSKRHKVYYTGL